jgi:hypothetical protein
MAHLTGAHAKRMQQCIEECTTCHDVCLETAAHALESGGAHARLLLDCAQICQTSADFMLRGSDLHTRTCFVCAEVCDRCAEECERMEGAEIDRCADACRSCAESCRRMAEMPAA